MEELAGKIGTTLQEIFLYQFKNHKNFHASLKNSCIILGPNGAGKSNFLEAVYLLVNGIFPLGRTLEGSIADEEDSGFIRANILLPSGLAPEFTITLNRTPSKVGFRIQGESTTRGKYLEHHGLRAMLFTPIEMNLLYLGPALRRDFLDEILLISHTEFQKVRREYLAALRSRNALLKRIGDREANPIDLDAWDILFVQKATKYYSYRKNLIGHIGKFLPEISSKVRAGLELSFEYGSKVPVESNLEDISEHIKQYLVSHREKDIYIGHTCIGPHLDDFSFTVETAKSRPNSAEFLSRGENKMILLYLKMIGISYIELHAKGQVVLLLDDIASELDLEHFSAITKSFGNRPFYLSGHRIPEYFFESKDIARLHLGEEK